MRVAVVGASGVAGRAFVAVAQAAGLELATQRVDLLQPVGIDAALRGCAAAVNLATSVPKPGGRGDWAINDRLRREGVANLVAACQRCGVPMLVQQSVAMLHNAADERPQTEDDPVVGYGVLQSAADMEAIARAAPMDVRLVRGGLFYGPGTGREEAWLADVARPGFALPGDGRGWVSPVHVGDYAQALLAVLLRGRVGQACIAADDEPLRWAQLYERVAARAGAVPPPPGGPAPLRSFRVSNARLRALGWAPEHPRFWC